MVHLSLQESPSHPMWEHSLSNQNFFPRLSFFETLTHKLGKVVKKTWIFYGQADPKGAGGGGVSPLWPDLKHL